MSIATRLTAEEYLAQGPTDRPTELVRGEVTAVNPGGIEHGEAAFSVGALLRNYVKPRNLGRVSGLDMIVVTSRDPDTVRGADVAYFRPETLPAGVRFPTYGPVPELIFEIRSPSDRPGEIAIKAGEYLNVGVLMVVVLDPARRNANVFTAEAITQLTEDDVIPLPAPLEELRHTVREWLG